MAKGGKRPGAGRPKGAKNKATVEREALAKQRAEIMEVARKARGDKLAVEYMQEHLRFAAGRAAFYQPTPTNPNANEKQFLLWANMALRWAEKLAPFESPTFRAITVAPPPPAPSESDGKRSFTLTIFEGGRRISGQAVGPSKKLKEADVLKALAVEDDMDEMKQA